MGPFDAVNALNSVFVLSVEVVTTTTTVAKPGKAGQPVQWFGWWHWLVREWTVDYTLVAITVVYAALTLGLFLVAHAERREHNRLLRSEQARQIAGHIDLSQDQPNTLVLSLVNASQLPVRAVKGIARQIGGPGVVEFQSVVVLKPPGETCSEAVPQQLHGADFVLHLRFDDDAGVRWEKYTSKDEWLREAPDDDW